MANFYIFLNFSANLVFLLPWQPIKFSGLDTIINLVEDYSMNISIKLLSKYLQRDRNKGILSIFPL